MIKNSNNNIQFFTLVKMCIDIATVRKCKEAQKQEITVHHGGFFRLHFAQTLVDLSRDDVW